MIYIIEFIPSSEKEFRKLSVELRKQFVEKLKECAAPLNRKRKIQGNEGLL